MDINLSILFNHKRFEGLLQTYKMMGVTIEGESTRSLHDKLMHAAKNLDIHLTHKMSTLTNGRWGSIVLPEKKNLIDFSKRGVIMLDDFKLRLDEAWDMIIKEGEG